MENPALRSNVGLFPTSGSSRLSARCQREYSPIPWINYFDEALDVTWTSNDQMGGDYFSQSQNHGRKNDSFRVYLKNFQPPYAPIRQLGSILDGKKSDTSTEQIAVYSEIPTLVMLHGGGYSALTWAEFANHLDYHCQFRMLAIDLRSHGDTYTEDQSKMDIDTLVEDVFAVIHRTHEICGFNDTPKTVLIGHSMGGAIAVKCATKCEEKLPSLVGFVVIDVVEGSAKEALPLMMSVIQTRPSTFQTLQKAIEWTYMSGMAKNLVAARVSTPGNLINLNHKHLAIHDVGLDRENNGKYDHILAKLKKHKFTQNDHVHVQSSLITVPQHAKPPRVAELRSIESIGCMKPPDLPPIRPIRNKCTIIEDEEDQVPSHQKPSVEDNKDGYTWRTDLALTQTHWHGWFDGLSNQLLEAPVSGKFLLLAGVDRLDKALTIGQMQGKFMMKVLAKCGHAVHEDLPDQVASSIGQFLVRNKFTKSLD